MSTTRVIKTARRDIYRNLVLRTARLELDDDEELEKDPAEFPFDYGYELFAAGLVIGFLEKENREESEGQYSQDFVEVDSVTSDEHRTAIEFVWELIRQEETELSETEAWELARQYADRGVERIQRDIETKDKFDLLGFMNRADGRWEDRLAEIVDYQVTAD